MQNQTVRYITTRPATAHPALPVHLERITTWREAVTREGRVIRNADGSPAMAERKRVEWVGSYPTEEIARGKITP